MTGLDNYCEINSPFHFGMYACISLSTTEYIKTVAVPEILGQQSSPPVLSHAGHE